jgi:hypothetical protein
MAATESAEIDLMTVVASNHGQAREATFRRFRLENDREPTRDTEALHRG